MFLFSVTSQRFIWQCQAFGFEVHNFWCVTRLFCIIFLSTLKKKKEFRNHKMTNLTLFPSVWLITCCCSRLKMQLTSCWIRLSLNRAKFTIILYFMHFQGSITWDRHIHKNMYVRGHFFVYFGFVFISNLVVCDSFVCLYFGAKIN